MREIRKHPSGRPIRKNETKGLPIFRNPGIGSYIPRLQRNEQTNAIGFHRFVIKDNEDED